MTDRDIIQRLIAHGENMRNKQKEYFKSRTREALIASKMAEKEFDNVLFNAKQFIK